MRFTDIRDDVLPTGHLTVFAPDAATRGRAERAGRDERRTSHNQEGHLLRALARRVSPDLLAIVPDPTGADGKAAPTGWLAVRFDLPPGTEVALGRALERWIDRHETLRSGFRADRSATEGASIERFTLPSGSVALEAVDHGEHTDPAVLAERLDDLFNASTDPVRWPAYVLASISPTGPARPASPTALAAPTAALAPAQGETPTEPATTTVILAFDHLNVDGYSMLLMAQEVRAMVETEVKAEAAGRAPALDPAPSHIDFVAAERERADRATSSHAAVTRWAEFLGPGHDVPAFPLPDGLAPGAQIPQRSCCLPILSEAEAAAFGRWCRDRGVSAGAGFLGAHAMACARRARRHRPPDADGRRSAGRGDDRFRVLVSTHTRDEPRWATALGWFTAIAPFEVALPATGELEDALPAVDEAWAKAKRGATLPLDRIGALLGRSIDPRFVVSYLDARHTPGSAGWRSWRAHAHLGDVGPTDEVYAWINRMPTETYLTWRHPDNETCAREVEAVTELMQQIIRDSLAAGTPPSGGQEVTAPW